MVRNVKYSPCFLAGAFLMLFNLDCVSQTVKGKLEFTTAQNIIYLLEVIGGVGYNIDSCKLSRENTFNFDMKGRPVGYYNIAFSNVNVIDFIYNNSEVEIVFRDSILQNNLEVVESIENQVLWEYKYYSRQKLVLKKEAQVRMSYLSENDGKRVVLQQYIDSLEEVKNRYLLKLCEEHPHTYFTKVVGASLPPVIGAGETSRSVYFNRIDFSDPTLIRSSVFPASMMGFFQTQTEYTEEGFEQSLDIILEKAAANEQVHEFCLNYLLELFNRVGPDIVFQHIVEKYLLSDGCSEINVSESMKNLASGYRALMIGNQAPDMFSISAEGKQISLYEEIKGTQKTVLFFWSSHCSFCHAAIPELKKWEEESNGDFQVIAFSLDTSEGEWKNYILENELNWINVSELKGWDSEAVKVFKIHKTPSFYLLGSDGTIISKPKTINEIESP